MNARMLCAAAALTIASGCASGPPFGDAVRNMADAQRADPSAPHVDAGGLDGQKAARALESYRAPNKASGKAPAPAAVLIPASN